MKSFDSPGDIKRAFQFLRKKTWENASPIDKAMLVSFMQAMPAGYSSLVTINAGILARDAFVWNWFTAPAALGSFGSGGSLSRMKFHNAGIKLPEFSKLNGWYFVPDLIQLDFFDAAVARKTGRIELACSELYSARQTDALADINLPERIIAAMEANAVRQRQVFAPGHHDFVGTNVNIGDLFPCVLLPYDGPQTDAGADVLGFNRWGAIDFKELTGLIATDIVRPTMWGRWHFSPGFIEEYTVSDD